MSGKKRERRKASDRFPVVQSLMSMAVSTPNVMPEEYMSKGTHLAKDTNKILYVSQTS